MFLSKCFLYINYFIIVFVDDILHYKGCRFICQKKIYMVLQQLVYICIVHFSSILYSKVLDLFRAYI